MRQVLGPGALGRPRGTGWRGRWEGGSGWGIHITPWLIHVNVWQNPLQCCEVISLQIIKINGKKFKNLFIKTCKKKKKKRSFLTSSSGSHCCYLPVTTCSKWTSLSCLLLFLPAGIEQSKTQWKWTVIPCQDIDCSSRNHFRSSQAFGVIIGFPWWFRW